MSNPKFSSQKFLSWDHPKTLFPLRTNLILASKGEERIREHIEKCLDPEEKGLSFLSQTKVFAAKSHGHVRRTVKLDSVAEYFIYDFVYSHRSLFRKPHNSEKQHYGYRFSDGEPLPPSGSYKGYKGNLSENEGHFSHQLSFDVASYFNSVYHHDLVQWLANAGADEDQYEALGQFLREINSGRSIDCLPQGLYPTKMVGNDFLRFIEEHHALKSSVVTRFMDDVTLFSDDKDLLEEDFYLIQRLLGAKGLSVNPAKTFRGKSARLDDDISEVRLRLLEKRRTITARYDESDNIIIEEEDIQINLDEEEMSYLRELLQNVSLEEDDAELVLAMMRDYSDEVAPSLYSIAAEFPHLAKNVYQFCSYLTDLESLSSNLLNIVKRRASQEYQLFWFAYILEDFLLETSKAPEIIEALLSHPNATEISKAKVLEIPDQRFGLIETRDAHLGAGRSDWLAWASALGHRQLPKISRQHKLAYFAKSSPMNKLIYDVLDKI